MIVVRAFFQLTPTPGSSPTASPSDPEVEDLGDAFGVVRATVGELAEGFLTQLPLIVAGVVLFGLGFLAASWLGRLTERGLRRAAAETVVVRLVGRLVRILVVVAFLLLGLAVMKVPVGAGLASLGIAGIALAFALQNILENFVAGILLLLRKPFRAGDQIRTSDFEGTVEDVDLRVTNLRTFDGVTVLIPNADVFRNPLTNLTRRGLRRTSVTVGVDYRDDHDRAREVLRAAIEGIEGVLDTPAPEVLLLELGDSSVNFELRYWTLPYNQNVQHTKDRVLSAAKTAIEEAGMTIPWPIRTLVFDNRLRVDQDGDASPADRR